MIRVRKVREPARFDAECRRPGNDWLARNPSAERLKPLWRAFVGALAEGFENRCGYSAIMIPNGTVDHFRSSSRSPRLAYEWSNYRYVDGRINAKKQVADAAVLDPYAVRDEWFELLLPSLQLRLTNRVPAKLRKRAQYTLDRLGLAHDEHVIAYRAQWYCQYHCGELSLAALYRIAPLLARALDDANQSPDPALCAGIAKPLSRRPRR